MVLKDTKKPVGGREQTDFSVYKVAERRYRSKKIATTKKGNEHTLFEPDLRDVIDFAKTSDPRIKLLSEPDTIPDKGPSYYGLDGKAGFVYIREAIPPAAQASWARRCLTQYSGSAHTNLTNLYGCHLNYDPWQATLATGDLRPIKRLRWASLGHRYNWSTRQYAGLSRPNHMGTSCTRQGSPTPSALEMPCHGFQVDPSMRVDSQLAELARSFADALGFTSFDAQAGLVNYYPFDSMMGDDAEHALDQPLVSFSLGLTCIFLLGGLSKDEEPVPMLFRSGDAMLMGGKSRRYFHGVPCMLTETAPNSLADPRILQEMLLCPENEAKLLAEYLRTSRVNFNVRQVLDDR